MEGAYMYIIWKNSPKNADGNIRGRRMAGVFNFLVLIIFIIYYFQILINKIWWKYTDKILEISSNYQFWIFSSY